MLKTSVTCLLSKNSMCACKNRLFYGWGVEDSWESLNVHPLRGCEKYYHPRCDLVHRIFNLFHLHLFHLLLLFFLPSCQPPFVIYLYFTVETCQKIGFGIIPLFLLTRPKICPGERQNCESFFEYVRTHRDISKRTFSPKADPESERWKEKNKMREAYYVCASGKGLRIEKYLFFARHKVAYMDFDFEINNKRIWFI